MKRIIIDERTSQVVLTFNQKFYPRELIEQSAIDFKDVCDSKFEGDQLFLKLKSNDVDLQNLGYEFYNYLFGLIWNK